MVIPGLKLKIKIIQIPVGNVKIYDIKSKNYYKKNSVWVLDWEGPTD